VIVFMSELIIHSADSFKGKKLLIIFMNLIESAIENILLINRI